MAYADAIKENNGVVTGQDRAAIVEVVAIANALEQLTNDYQG